MDQFYHGVVLVCHAVPLLGGGQEGGGGHLCSVSGNSTGLYYSYGGPDIRLVFCLCFACQKM